MTADDVVVVAGTRPEAIKLLGLIGRLGTHARLVHTGQHYDPTMWENVLGELPDVEVSHHIGVGGLGRGEQIGAATTELTRYLTAHPARAVVVQGDTNSSLAGALAANALGLPLVHVEAGLRSHDRSMPEEANRILIDAIADLCCAPTPDNAAQLRAEGVGEDRIRVTGNTLAEAMTALLPPPGERAAIVADVLGAGTASGTGGSTASGTAGGTQSATAAPEFVLTTVHRASNVDDPERLLAIVAALAELATHVPVVLPAHPRTVAALNALAESSSSSDGRSSKDASTSLRAQLRRLVIVPPLSPRAFLALEAEATLLLSDSGGVQEEACFLRRPLLVLRDSTERPELLAGWCRLLGDENPTSGVLRAWSDTAHWTSWLNSNPSAYPAVDASALIVGEIDRRWPAPVRMAP